LINLQTTGEIAAILETTEEHLRWTLMRVPRLCHKLTIEDLDRPKKKPRVVYDPRGRLRTLQKKIHTKILLPGLERFPNSHGGVPGKNILTSVRRHKKQQFVYCGDIHNFYPSIHYSRVLGLFLELGCSDEAAKVLTRLCTNHHRIEQGFITSPILADRLFHSADKRIVQLCKKHDLIYTRYVDDVTISSPFDLKKSGIPKTIAKILAATGFMKNEDKDRFGSISKGTFILGLRVKKGDRPNASADYLEETRRRLTAMIALGNGEKFHGQYYSRNELWGRLGFAAWVNKTRMREIMSIWRSVDWDKVEAEADRRGIVTRRKRFKIKRESVEE
jgi:Reverse transcriptase (RNA-dependent DNA polymerase)